MRPLYELISCGHYVVDHCHKPMDGNYPITLGRKVLFEHETFISQSAVIRPAQFKTEIAIIEADKPEYCLDLGDLYYRKYDILFRAFVDTKITIPAGAVFQGKVLLEKYVLEIEKDTEVFLKITGSKEESHFLAFVEIPGVDAFVLKGLLDDILAQANAYTDDEVGKVEEELTDKIDDLEADLNGKIEDLEDDLNEKIDEINSELDDTKDKVEKLILRVSLIKSEYEAADEEILKKANRYTDAKIKENDLFDADELQKAAAALEEKIDDLETKSDKIDKWLKKKIDEIEIYDPEPLQKQVDDIEKTVNYAKSMVTINNTQVIIGKEPARLLVDIDGVYHNSKTNDNKLVKVGELDEYIFDDGTW